MNNVVAILGTQGGTCFSKNGFEVGLSRIGENTGNSLFQYAINSLINNPKVFVDASTDPAYVRDTASILVIPAANQINPAWDLSSWASFVERCDLPVACIGLGAQAEIDDSPKLTLQPGTVRFAKAVAERTQDIGVRGQYTQDVLEELGIRNTVITGCPSQTINPTVSGQDIQAKLQALRTESVERVAYILGTLEEGARETERLLAKIAASHNHDLILQTDPALLRSVYTRSVSDHDQEHVRWIGATMRPDLTYEEYNNYLLSHGKFFSGAATWIDTMRGYDVAFGMRIHGAVAAIQSGGVGICVAFDSRTRELAHTMGYPYVLADDIASTTSIADIAASAIFSPERFDHLKQVLGRRIRTLLMNAGCYLSS